MGVFQNYWFAGFMGYRARDASGVVHEVIGCAGPPGYRQSTRCTRPDWALVEPIVIVEPYTTPTCIQCLGVPS